MVTGGTDEVTSAGATLQGSFSGATGTITETGFYWGTSQNALTSELYAGSGSGAAGSFSASLSSLRASTTYWYKAYVLEYNARTGQYEYRYGSVRSFTTAAPAAVSKGYLACYEVPAVTTSGTGSAGAETFGSTKWSLWDTGSSTQKVVTHTYSYDGKQYRNYTCLVDKTKKAPLWSAFVMHSGAYPDNKVGRTGSWGADPALDSSWQQDSSDDNYSRGHFVASSYRQACSDANKQTFYQTNQALQWQNGFNSGVWSSLETDVKGHAPTGRDSLYVVVGVLYENSTTSGGVPVPSHFYKLLMKCSFNTSGTMTAASGCAYLFTNESHTGESYSSFITSIDAVEQRSGFDFFANVPSPLQEAAERQTSALW